MPMMMMMTNCFCDMVDRRKVFSFISSLDHCQRSSPSRISDTLRAGCTHPKKAVLISDKKAKEKSKRVEFLTDRRFFDKINNDYDLKQLIRHFFSLLMYFIKEHGDLMRKVQETLNPKILKTKSGRLIMQSKCNAIMQS